MCTKDNVSGDEGVVYKKSTSIYFVRPLRSPDRVIPCSISSHLRKELVYPTAAPSSVRRRVRQVKELDHGNPLAVGDGVRFVETGRGSGMIVEVLPRRSQLSRRMAGSNPGGQAFEQVLAANVDQIVPVFAAADPSPHWNMLDRYLVSAESFHLPAVICITKMDLVQGSSPEPGKEIEAAAAEYRQIGYPVRYVSVVTGKGLDDLREVLRGRVSVFVGKSGVGKTSLLNTLQPGLGQRIHAVNPKTGKGRHTTTSPELFPLDIGGAVLDTPGMREVGLWDDGEEDLAKLFPEMRYLVGMCRFRLDCRHDEEPGCAVRQAVMRGEISPRRYQSFLRMREDWRRP